MATSKKAEAAEATETKGPAPAETIHNSSGALMEPEIKDGVELSHPSIDSNPRLGTAPAQSARDMNDPLKRTPADPDYVGQGLDPAPFGHSAKSEDA